MLTKILRFVYINLEKLPLNEKLIKNERKLKNSNSNLELYAKKCISQDSFYILYSDFKDFIFILL